MAKKQTRRSISVSRTTYERLKAFCEANNVSMSQFVESRVGDFLGESTGVPAPRPTTIRPEPNRSALSSTPVGGPPRTQQAAPPPVRPAPPVPMTAASARYAVEPPPPIIKKVDHEPAPAPIVKTADQIFTF
jgi:hypothetical protein